MRIYLDHNATTPVRPEVADAMARMLREDWGNPSSTHAEGAAAKRALDRAREAVAALVGAAPGELIFTGSATEANNAALHQLAGRAEPLHVVTSTIEHPSIDEPLREWAAPGRVLSRVPVGAGGRLDPAELLAAVRDDTTLVVLILANNETGVVQPIEEIGAALRDRGIPLHVDATQAVGKIPVDLERLGAASLAGSAHKFNGPKGCGFLALRGAAFAPLLRGGPQERRRRGGTENTAGIVGMGVAAELAQAEAEERRALTSALRDRLWDGIRKSIDDVHRNGDPDAMLPNTLNCEFRGAAGEVLLEALDGEGIAVSAGAACASGSIEPSPILSAMGRTPAQARASLRLSVGDGNDAEQVDRVVALLPPLVERVRTLVS